jgi:hypothetical protein
VLAALAVAGALIAFLLLGGGGSSKGTPHLTTIAKHDVPTIVSDLKSLVDANTR